MSSLTADSIDDKLLAKYLAGESTPEEAIEVDEWIEASEKHRRLFDQAAAVWQGTPENIQPQTSPATPLRTINLYRAGIAASLLALAAAVWLLVRSPQVKPSGTNNTPPVALITKWAGAAILRDTLPDNSVVVQNANSVIQYAGDFSGGNREIRLAGEAWFDVKPNTVKPFVVKMGSVRVVVLGTSFNIQQSPSHIEIAVKTGSVMMIDAADSLVVKSAQKGVYDIKSNKFIKFNSFNINDQGYATKVLTFENLSLGEIAEQIEKAYGVSVVFQDEKLKDLTMSSSFDNDSITYIFDVISITLHVNYKIKNNVVYIGRS